MLTATRSAGPSGVDQVNTDDIGWIPVTWIPVTCCPVGCMMALVSAAAAWVGLTAVQVGSQRMVQDRASAEAFGPLAVELRDAEGVEETVEAVVQFALQAICCDYASVVLIIGNHKPEIMALTDPNLAKLYEQQIDAAGPLITVIRQGQTLLIPDVLTETRWSQALGRAGHRRREPQRGSQLAAGDLAALTLPL